MTTLSQRIERLEKLEGEELKACPFCGENMKAHKSYYSHGHNGCVLQAMGILSSQLQSWNTRPAMTEALSIIRELRERLEVAHREKWYGFAGHLCVGRSCAYHLCTQIQGYLISTVGAYYPHSADKMEPIGSGADALYETYVFRCKGEDENGDPIIDYGEVDGQRYASSLEAENGHYRYLEKYRLTVTDLTQPKE